MIQQDLLDALMFLETDAADALSTCEIALGAAKRNPSDANLDAEVRLTRVLGLLRAVAATVDVVKNLAMGE